MRQGSRITVLLLAVVGLTVGCTADSPTVPDVERIEPPPRLLVPGGADGFYDEGDTITIVAHFPSDSSAPQNVISAAQTAASRWNDEALGLAGHTSDLPHFNSQVVGGTGAPGTIARIVYTDSSTGPTNFGYCGNFNGEIEGVREIKLTKKDMGDPCGGLGRVVNDLTGVIMHEMSHLLGFDHQSDPETTWCVTNVPDEGNLNPHLCRWEVQSIYAAYDIRISDPFPTDTIANRIVVLPNPDTVLTGSNSTVTAHGLVDPEPSQNVDAGGDPEAPWLLPPDTITLEADWDDDGSLFFSVTDLSDGDARVDGIQVGQGPLAAKAEDQRGAVYPWPVDTATIVVESASGLSPCFDEETTFTWRFTDQYLSAACGSTGPNIRYRWRFEDGGAWTSFSADTLYEFLGHSSADTFQVSVEVKDTSSGATEQFSKLFHVVDSLVSMSGPTYVTDKQLKTYQSTRAGKWYERYENSFDWNLVLGTYRNYSEYSRIWAAGEYTTRLRVEVIGGGLGRDWLDVEVCHESIPGCGVQFAVLPSGGTDFGLPLFGGGPWIASDSRLIRFYDLTGLHEPASPFADIGWIEPRSRGRAISSDGGAGLSWEVTAATADTRVIEFVVGETAGRYTFGLALDPDIGKSPADDRSYYDSASGALVAYDGTEALGFVLLKNGSSDLQAVKQYGAHRFAPREASALRQASREPGVDLTTEDDDVQFFLSGSETAGVSTWTLLVARGATRADVLERLEGLARN